MLLDVISCSIYGMLLTKCRNNQVHGKKFESP